MTPIGENCRRCFPGCTSGVSLSYRAASSVHRRDGFVCHGIYTLKRLLNQLTKGLDSGRSGSSTRCITAS